MRCIYAMKCIYGVRCICAVRCIYAVSWSLSLSMVATHCSNESAMSSQWVSCGRCRCRHIFAVLVLDEGQTNEHWRGCGAHQHHIVSAFEDARLGSHSLSQFLNLRCHKRCFIVKKHHFSYTKHNFCPRNMGKKSKPASDESMQGEVCGNWKEGQRTACASTMISETAPATMPHQHSVNHMADTHSARQAKYDSQRSPGKIHRSARN